MLHWRNTKSGPDRGEIHTVKTHRLCAPLLWGRDMTRLMSRPPQVQLTPSELRFARCLGLASSRSGYMQALATCRHKTPQYSKGQKKNLVLDLYFYGSQCNDLITGVILSLCPVHEIVLLALCSTLSFVSNDPREAMLEAVAEMQPMTEWTCLHILLVLWRWKRLLFAFWSMCVFLMRRFI